MSPISPEDPEFTIHTSKDGLEKKSWRDIAYAEGVDPDFVRDWDRETWDGYYGEMEKKYPGFERPWKGLPESNSHPSLHRAEMATMAAKAALASAAYDIPKRMQFVDKAKKAAASGAVAMAELAAREEAVKRCAERCAKKEATEFREAKALERRESTGGRRRTSNAKYYNKRRGTKRRRSKRHRSKKHRSKKHRS